ncbi:MAG: hypothetical protein ABSE21_08795, partial [Bryobacteraceae bacterium]
MAPPARRRERSRKEVGAPSPAPAAVQPANATSLLTQLLNDTGNADRLIAFRGTELRYCPAIRKWLVWDGRRWAVDDKGAIRRAAKLTMLEFLSQAAHADDADLQKFAYGSLDARRINNMIAMAECEMVITPDQLDTHPFLLNFLNGTLDLRTGELKPHDEKLYLTKLVHHNYEPQAECSLFLSFLGRIMGGHADASEPDLERADRMVEYLQRAL